MKKGKRILAVLLCAIIAIGAFALVGCGGQTAKETYLIKYDLNYEGGETRNVSVQAGAKAVSWRATREGFDLGGWFTDADGTKPYDFGRDSLREMDCSAGYGYRNVRFQRCRHRRQNGSGAQNERDCEKVRSRLQSVRNEIRRLVRGRG